MFLRTVKKMMVHATNIAVSLSFSTIVCICNQVVLWHFAECVGEIPDR